jgi:ABC-2 type transport system permease protein
MTEQSPDPQRIGPAAISPTRPMYWSVRRELWENRSIFIAPAAVAGLTAAGFLISLFQLPAKMRAASALGPVEQHKIFAQPYSLAAGLMMLTTLVVGIFYCLDALYGECRDRSILFWKSMPLSDLETILSKMITPVVILPLVTFAAAIATQSIMLLVSSAVLLATGASIATLWTHASLFQTWPMLLYHLLTVHGLWYAPIYGWLLMVSVWARRAPVLWATLPLLAVGVVEKIAFNSSHFGAMLINRMLGGPGDDFMAGSLSMHPLTHFAPGHFLISPGLWIGLLFAAIFLAVAVRLRRHRGPIWLAVCSAVGSDLSPRGRRWQTEKLEMPGLFAPYARLGRVMR